MKYAVNFVGCMIIEADTKEEAENFFFAETYETETSKITSIKPCYKDIYGYADNECNIMAKKLIEI